MSKALDQSLVKTYRYQTASVPPLHIDSVHVWLEKNAAIIDGEVSRLPVYAVDPNDYMEITVIDSHGKILSCMQTHYFPKHVGFPGSRRGRNPSVYATEIKFIPPPASTIKVVYVRLN